MINIWTYVRNSGNSYVKLNKELSCFLKKKIQMQNLDNNQVII